MSEVWNVQIVDACFFNRFSTLKVLKVVLDDCSRTNIFREQPEAGRWSRILQHIWTFQMSKKHETTFTNLIWTSWNTASAVKRAIVGKESNYTSDCLKIQVAKFDLSIMSLRFSNWNPDHQKNYKVWNAKRNNTRWPRISAREKTMELLKWLKTINKKLTQLQEFLILFVKHEHLWIFVETTSQKPSGASQPYLS